MALGLWLAGAGHCAGLRQTADMISRALPPRKIKGLTVFKGEVFVGASTDPPAFFLGGIVDPLRLPSFLYGSKNAPAVSVSWGNIIPIQRRCQK